MTVAELHMHIEELIADARAGGLSDEELATEFAAAVEALTHRLPSPRLTKIPEAPRKAELSFDAGTDPVTYEEHGPIAPDWHGENRDAIDEDEMTPDELEDFVLSEEESDEDEGESDESNAEGAP
jgi:hypothetical protein